MLRGLNQAAELDVQPWLRPQGDTRMVGTAFFGASGGLRKRHELAKSTGRNVDEREMTPRTDGSLRTAATLWCGGGAG